MRELQFGGALARQRQLSARFCESAARVGVGALQGQQARARQVAFGDQLLVELEFLGGEPAGVFDRSDLARECRGLCAGLTHLSLKRVELLVERAASRGELRAFTHQVLGALRVAGQLRVDDEFARERALGAHARMAQALGTELIFEQAELGVAAHVVHDHQHVTGMHRLPVAHADFAHDAAFAVLDGLALQLHLDARGGDHRSRDRRKRRPDSQRGCHHGQGNQHDAAIQPACGAGRFVRRIEQRCQAG